MGPCIRNGVGPDAADDTRNALQRPKRRDFVIEIPHTDAAITQHGPTGDNIAIATDYYPRKRRASGTVSTPKHFTSEDVSLRSRGTISSRSCTPMLLS